MPFAPVARLSPGDCVSVIAPAAPFDRDAFARGLARLASRYTPIHNANLFEAHRYLAGSDAGRLASLQEAFDHPTSRAVFAVRGGYGALRLLPGFRPSARALVGFSDITALHAAMQQSGLRSLHAPVLTQLGSQNTEVFERLISTLEGALPSPLLGSDTVVPGIAEGPLLGGNLATLSRLIGTPFMPSLRGAVLLLEEVGERPYRLDRMWTHLRLANCLEGVSGVVVGELTGCEEKDAAYTAAEVLRDLVGELRVPCAAGFPIGHGATNLAVVLGARVRLDATAKRLEHLEGLT